MWNYTAVVSMSALLGMALVGGSDSVAQTPEQRQVWEAQRAQALIEENAKAERLARERAARKADPMAWVRTLDPMSAGGWEFRTVASDGSWATYTTDHQMKRAGKIMTVWLRQEYAEPQRGDDSRYLSTVKKVQYNCAKEQVRELLVVYYADNNIQGTQRSEEADPKTTAWDAIVPGSREETSFLWTCRR